MKKILLTLLALSLIFGAVYAQDGGITPEIELESSVTWGIDLGRAKNASPAHGFNNSTDFSFILPLFSDNLSKKGDADVGIEFKLSTNRDIGPEVSFDGSNTGIQRSDSTAYGRISEVAAKLNFFGAYLQVYGRPDFYSGYAKRDWSIVEDETNHKMKYAAVGRRTRGDLTAYGLSLGYAADSLGGSDAGIDAKLKLASNGDWEVGLNEYALGADVDFTFGDLVYSGLAFNLTFNDPTGRFKSGDSSYNSTTMVGSSLGNKAGKPYMGLGFQVGSKAVEGLDVKFAMDMFPNAAPGNAMDFLFDATYKWVNFALYAGNKYAYTGYNKKGEATGNMDMRLAFTSAASGDTNLVEGLNFDVSLHLNDLLNGQGWSDDKNESIPLGIHVGAGYKANLSDSMWIKPYFDLWGETNNYTGKDGKEKFGLAYQIGATYSPLENVEIDACWKHGGVKNVRGVEGLGSVVDKLYSDEQGHKGRFTLGLKLIY